MDVFLGCLLLELHNRTLGSFVTEFRSLIDEDGRISGYGESSKSVSAVKVKK